MRKYPLFAHLCGAGRAAVGGVVGGIRVPLQGLVSRRLERCGSYCCKAMIMIVIMNMIIISGPSDSILAVKSGCVLT